MERDFTGLAPKKPSSVTVKQEITDDSIASSNSEPMTRSGVQWSISSKISNSPQILSFNSAQEGGSHKLNSPGVVQRNLHIEQKQGSHLPTSHQRMMYGTQSLNHPREKKTFPASSQANPMVSVAMGSAAQSHLLPTGHNLLSSLSVGAASMVPSIPVVPANNAIVGSTDLGSSVKLSNGAAQLTIFYNGSVCVYDDVSYEKAQAIMLLAGIGNLKNPNAAVPTTKVQLQVPKPAAGDVVVVPKTPSFSGAASMFPPVGSSSGKMPGAAVEVHSVKPVALLAPQNNKPELPRSTPRGAAAVNLVPSGVPLARKASLARFLEKRKERVLSASPYNTVDKNSSECSTSGVDPAAFVLNSATSFPLPAVI
ncbi:hypothetical protein Ancab_012691 [Ancistrocladus abbreviatus]